MLPCTGFLCCQGPLRRQRFTDDRWLHLLENNIAAADATVIRRLTQAGMVLLGKTHTVQFAYGGVGINHHHGTPHNPWHAVPHARAVRVVALAWQLRWYGADGAGQRYRGFRPHPVLPMRYGRTQNHGGSDQPGWRVPPQLVSRFCGALTRSVEDAALVYQCLQGSDPQDPSTQGIPPQDVLTRLKDGVRGLRLAFAETIFWDQVDAEVAQAVRSCGEVLSGWVPI